jgi:hypothetical protein
MPSPLKQITTAAKKIYARGGTWKGAIKKAGAEYRAGKLGKIVHMKTKRKKSRRKIGRSTGVLYNSSGKNATMRAAAVSGRPYNGMIGGGGHDGDSGGMIGSINNHIKHAKKGLEHEIGKLETRKFIAKKKSVKKKIAKKIALIKSKFRKLC